MRADLTIIILCALIGSLLHPANAVGAPAAPEALLAESKDPLVRESAAQVLGQRGDARQLPALIKSMSKDQNIWVRARCAEALGLIGDPKAIPSLRAVLAREKDQRTRRSISQALVRLGQSAGLDELTWQLKTGTNHARAEVMEFLVAITGQPLGQNVDSWMHYLRTHGRDFLSRRPGGSPSVIRLPGLPSGPAGATQGPCLSSPKPQPTWGQSCATVVDLLPSSKPVTAQRLRQYARERGPIPDHCWILIRTGWKEAQLKAPAAGKPPPRIHAGITLEVARTLLQMAPHLTGIGIDAPALDAQGSPGSAREHLLSKGRMVLEGLNDLELLPPWSARLLMVPQSPAAVNCTGRAPAGNSYQGLILFGILP